MRNCAILLLILMSAAMSVSAQIPSLLVTPSKVTVVVGESHTFRAVGPDGRIVRGVHWRVSPVYSAELRADDEAEVSATVPKEFKVIADYQGQEATALVTVIAGYFLPEGTVRWSVKELPGFKTVKLMPAVPSSDGPDIFAEEVGPSGSIIRAYTEDGRELWRTALSGQLSVEVIAQQQSNLSSKKESVCASIKIGSTKTEIAALKEAADYAANPPLFKRDEWVLEQPGVVCHVLFDPNSTVLKTRRELTND